MSAQHPAKYWVEFKDKKDSPYSINRPEEFLSPRAIEKRHRFNIPITEQDLPVNESYIKKLLAIDKTMVLFSKSKWLNGVTVYSEKENIMDKILELPFVSGVECTAVMGSKEDFEIMFRKSDADTVYRSEIAFYTKKFIYTQGALPVELRADGGLKKQYPVSLAGDTVSTIGAGDNFNAGFVYGLIKYGITREMIQQGLTEQQWDGLIGCAQQFSAEVCKSIDNYVSPEFGKSHSLSEV